VFQASSAIRTFWVAVSVVNGGKGGRGGSTVDMGLLQFCTILRQFGAMKLDFEHSPDFPGLSPILRVLLVTDGTVTKTLEAYFGEGIEVDVLEHAERTSESPYPQIDIAAGDRILHRYVRLLGKVTRKVYAVAESAAVLEHISQRMRHQLVHEHKGIGELLREGRLETYRELLTATLTAAGRWAEHLRIAASASVVTRDYRIYQGGRAVLLIREVFPESLT
jgi:chorismate-pyruvate lyase